MNDTFDWIFEVLDDWIGCCYCWSEGGDDGTNGGWSEGDEMSDDVFTATNGGWSLFVGGGADDVSPIGAFASCSMLEQTK